MSQAGARSITPSITTSSNLTAGALGAPVAPNPAATPGIAATKSACRAGAVRLSRRSLLGSGLAAAVPLAAGVPVAAAAAPAPDGDDLLLDLWHRRAEVLAQIEALDDAIAAASARMPWWAQPGPRYVDGQGRHVGEISGWPAVEDAGVPEYKLAHRLIRISPRDIRKHMEETIRTIGPKAVPEARARAARKLRALANRQRRQRAEEARVGLPAIEAASEAAGDRLCEIDRQIESLPPTIATMAAVMLMHNEIGYIGAALHHARPLLPSALVAEIDRRFVRLA